jgi:hypothetical protein
LCDGGLVWLVVEVLGCSRSRVVDEDRLAVAYGVDGDEGRLADADGGRG